MIPNAAEAKVGRRGLRRRLGRTIMWHTRGLFYNMMTVYVLSHCLMSEKEIDDTYKRKICA